MTESHSDRQLLSRFQAGGETAFASFYERHSRSLYAFLLSLVATRETAEELLQETFLSLLRGLSRLELKDDMRPFLFTIARNLAIDWRRREKRGREALARHREDAFFKTSPYGDRPLGGADPEELSRLLHRLPDAQRETVVLRALAGMTFREIALVVGASENTIVSRYRYAIDKLRSRLVQGGRREREH